METKSINPARNLTAFIDDVLNRFDEQITDNVFCFIESDKELMKKYLDTVAETGNLQTVNSQIGEKIAEHYGLDSIKDESGNNLTIDNPKSNLIQTHSKLMKQ